MQQAICYNHTNPSVAHGEGQDQTDYTEATESCPMHGGGGAGASLPSPPILTPAASLAVLANKRYHCQQSCPDWLRGIRAGGARGIVGGRCGGGISDYRRGLDW
jgi:hypothetical protein